MKFDMHCHTKEGSPDSEIPIMEYISLLIQNGYHGMMVTDHNSYEGYETYLKQKELVKDDFIILKGIEYDTLDAGHFLVVMPDQIELEILKYRGLCLKKLIDIVHKHGGVLGPAHPCGEPFLSCLSTGRYRKDRSIVKCFDFMEGYNCGEDEEANRKAQLVANQYEKMVTAGSDAHWKACIGLAYTIFDNDILCNNDFIDYIKQGNKTCIWGKPYNGTLKARLGKWNKLLVYGFFPYNKLGALKYFPLRKKYFQNLTKRDDMKKRNIKGESENA